MQDNSFDFPNDADIEMAGLESIARRSRALRRKGICTHGCSRTPPGQKETTCLDCGKVFASFEEMAEERRELLI